MGRGKILQQGPSASSLIPQPWEDAFSFSQVAFLVSCPGVYSPPYRLIPVCTKVCFSGAYNVFLIIVRYNTEALECKHSLYSKVFVLLYWYIVYKHTYTHCFISSNTLCMPRSLLVYLIVQGSKAVAVVPAFAGAEDLCAEVMPWYDIPLLPVCRDRHFSLGMGAFWSAARCHSHNICTSAENHPWLGDFRGRGLWVL